VAVCFVGGNLPKIIDSVGISDVNPRRKLGGIAEICFDSAAVQKLVAYCAPVRCQGEAVPANDLPSVADPYAPNGLGEEGGCIAVSACG
jgi:hypothetical protein